MKYFYLVLILNINNSKLAIFNTISWANKEQICIEFSSQLLLILLITNMQVILS